LTAPPPLSPDASPPSATSPFPIVSIFPTMRPAVSFSLPLLDSPQYFFEIPPAYRFQYFSPHTPTSITFYSNPVSRPPPPKFMGHSLTSPFFTARFSKELLGVRALMKISVYDPLAPLEPCTRNTGRQHLDPGTLCALCPTLEPRKI